MRRIRRAAVVGVFALVAIAFPAQAALAGTPNNQACLGHDFSGYAQGGSAFGGFVSGLASGTQGIGNEVQAHLAGQIPDSVIPNTCNN
jgi:hypothetical protein